MTEQSLNTNTLPSRLQRNGKNSLGSKNFTSQLTEENLKLHTAMCPSSRETKMHLVLVYVDLQKQLVALEAQMRIEAKAAQEKFSMSLPKNTPPVIPEIIRVPIIKSAPLLSSQSPIEGNDLSHSYNHYTSTSTSASIKAIEEKPSLLDSLIKNMKGSHRIKSLFKNTTKKTGNSVDNNGDLSPLSIPSSLTSYFDRDNSSLRVEPSIPQTCSRPKSLKKPKAPLNGIFIPKPNYNRKNSVETMNTMTHNSFTSSAHNLACSPTRISLSAPSTPMTPNYVEHTNNELHIDSTTAINNERCENIATLDNRDSGIALVSPGGKSNHSREHSISSLLRRIDTFNGFNKTHNQKNDERKEKRRGSIHSTIRKSKENEHELLAFRYPSLNDISY